MNTAVFRNVASSVESSVCAAGEKPADQGCEALLDGLSVDVEDYYHVRAFAHTIRPEMWTQFPSRVADNTRRVLELLEKRGARATFFLLGWVAEREKALVREILKAGHEVGCHSYWHQCVWRLGREEFRADTRRARLAIEDAGGQQLLGYRAPNFSIAKRSLWAIEILAEEGFLYDSSIFPGRHNLYGIPGAPRFPFEWVCSAGRKLLEVPPQTVRVLGRSLPVGGGGYLRILPMWYTRWAFRRIREHERRPVTIYFHPWELDPGQPRIASNWKARLRHYTNLRRMEERLAELLRQGKFVSLAEFLRGQLLRGPVPMHRLAHESASVDPHTACRS